MRFVLRIPVRIVTIPVVADTIKTKRPRKPEKLKTRTERKRRIIRERHL